ncbi:hypothetical protein ZONE111905_16405 [Zobellia nedashkovskayae]
MESLDVFMDTLRIDGDNYNSCKCQFLYQGTHTMSSYSFVVYYYALELSNNTSNMVYYGIPTSFG